jgi:hypothetical protein
MVNDLVPYAEARQFLHKRFAATREEIEAWVTVEQSSAQSDPTRGQLNVYGEDGEWVRWNPALHPSHNLASITGMFFSRHELQRFNPEKGLGRWLTLGDLVTRWRKKLDEKEIVDMITDAHGNAVLSEQIDLSAGLFAFSPATFWAGDPTKGLFREAQVEAFEYRRGLVRTPATKTLARALERMLEELERQDSDFQRGQMPGIKHEFQDFLSRMATRRGDTAVRMLATVSLRRLCDVLAIAECRFKPGTHRGTSYWRDKFPELYEPAS